MSYGMENNDEEARKLYCGNLDSQVDEELLYELFTQAGPVDKIVRPRDRNGCVQGYGFVVFKHEVSVPYAIELFEDTTLFGKLPKLNTTKRGNVHHQRTQSAPANFTADNPGPSPSCQMDFDNLLQMSQNMLNAGPGGREMRPPIGMGLHMGMQPGFGMGSLMGPPIVMGPRMGRRPSPGRHFNVSEPLPPGEEEPDPGPNRDDGPSRHDSYNRNFGGNALSQSSLQGNWSARNSSHMLPAENNWRSGHHSRRDRGPYSDTGRQDYYNRNNNRSNNYDRSGGGYHSRDRYRDNYHDREGHRSRSNDSHERRGRY